MPPNPFSKKPGRGGNLSGLKFNQPEEIEMNMHVNNMLADGTAIEVADSFSLSDAIATHRQAVELLDETDAAVAKSEAAFQASFEGFPLELPASGRTFASLRARGANHEITRRSTVNEFGMGTFEGVPSDAEIDRLRRVEAGIRSREQQFFLPELSRDLEDAAAIEEICLDILLRLPVRTLADARAKLEYLIESRDFSFLDVQALCESFG